jgi:uncharacterized membrane protein YccC
MVEQIMFVGIGFLIAGLLVIGVIPLVHARAVRLTIRRLEDVTPHSMAEIQADKDQLRAEFAMTISRLEINLDQVKVKTTNQLAELGRTISRLKLELGERPPRCRPCRLNSPPKRARLRRPSARLQAGPADKSARHPLSH